MKLLWQSVLGCLFLFSCTPLESPPKEAPKKNEAAATIAPQSKPIAPVSASAPSVGVLPEATRGPIANGPKLTKWIQERVANAKAGSPELVRVPLSFVTGWGCECPEYQIGFAEFEGAEFNLWATPILGPGVTLPNFPEYMTDPDNPKGEKLPVGSAGLNWLIIAEGYFTGNTKNEPNPDEGKPYIISEFQVLRYRLFKSMPDYHFGTPDDPEKNPDSFAYILLSGEDAKQKLPPLDDAKPWVIMAGSFSLSSPDTPTKSEELKEKLIKAGFPAESFDSRRAEKLFCCYQVVVAGRYATETEAKPALAAVKKSFPDAYVKQAF
jgi:hypothetical protein